MAFSRRGKLSSSNSLAETPFHFFKVILPATLEDKKLMIPDKFVRKFGDELSALAKLIVPNGHVFNVGLTKDGKKMRFNDGWHEFVEYFSICAGYFLVFRYEKNSNFHVLIFDKTACEIHNPHYCGRRENGEQNSLHKDEMKSDDSEIMDFAMPNSPSTFVQNKAFNKRPASSSKLYTPPLQLKRHKPSFGQANRSRKCGTSFETPTLKYPYNPDSSTQDENGEEGKLPFRFYGSAPARKRTVRTDERERVIDAANAFEPSNPFCRVVMQPSYFSIMYLPSCFSRNHLSGVSGFIKLQHSDGRQWPVFCRPRRHRITFGQGWRGFILENNLREGDICVFELLRSNDVVLKVTVFHVLESAEFVNLLPSGSALGGNKSQKCVASHEHPKSRHGVDIHSKKCKIEDLDVSNKCYAVGDESELIKERHKVEAHSSDNKNERIKFYELELSALLEDKGIFVTINFRHSAAEERARVTAAVRLFKPKNPSFMVILQPHNLRSRRVFVPVKFGKKYLNRDLKCIKVQDSDGREWPGIAAWYGGCCRINGLAGLMREKNLGEGDICIFELIMVNELLKVSVFYASTE